MVGNPFNSKKKSPPHSSCSDEILPYSATADDFNCRGAAAGISKEEIVRRGQQCNVGMGCECDDDDGGNF